MLLVTLLLYACTSIILFTLSYHVHYFMQLHIHPSTLELGQVAGKTTFVLRQILLVNMPFMLP